MKRFFGVALAAALLAAPVAVEAQQQGQRGPAFPILRFQSELGLSADQVARLQAIQERLRAQNEPLMAQLRASGAWQRERGPRAHLSEEQRAEMRERMQNLTPEQRAEMRERMQKRRGGAGQRAEGQRRGPRGEGERAEGQRRGPRGEGERAEGRRGYPRGEGQRAGGRQVPEELRPVLQQLQANRQAAMQEARAVLTSEQQNRLRELMQQRRGERATRQGR